MSGQRQPAVCAALRGCPACHGSQAATGLGMPGRAWRGPARGAGESQGTARGVWGGATIRR